MNTSKYILANFTNIGEVINKSVTEFDFKANYTPETHEIYTRESLVNFEKAVREEFGEREAKVMECVDKAIEGLSRLDVKSIDGKVTPVWVKAKNIE